MENFSFCAASIQYIIDAIIIFLRIVLTQIFSR